VITAEASARRRGRNRPARRNVIAGTSANTSCSSSLKTITPERPVAWASTVGRMFRLRQAL
jgi:hypothetical protein